MKKRVWFIIMCLIVTLLPLSGCGGGDKKELQGQITELTQQITSLQEENEVLSAQVDEYKGLAEASDNEFLSIYFWGDGVRYQAKGEITFYSDCFCSETVFSQVTFTSSKTAKVNMKNGLTVYASMSPQGVVWSTVNPEFEPLESKSWNFSWSTHQLPKSNGGCFNSYILNFYFLFFIFIKHFVIF